MNTPSRSLTERYSTAISTSHLEVLPTPGDVDMLIAAGWARAQLGSLLLRLRAEWDQVSGEYKLAKRHLHEAEHMGRIMERKAGRCPDAAANILKQRSDMLANAERAVATAYTLALTRLPTLTAAKHDVAACALRLAARKGLEWPSAAIIDVAQRTLQVWLDDRCPFCNGRGFTGGTHRADPIVICQQCDAGRARLRIGANHEAHEFGRALLRVVEVSAARTTRHWKKFLARGDRPPTTNYQAALAERLRELNSDQAAED